MNIFWKYKYQGVSVLFTIGPRECWKSHFSSTLWQLSLGYVQFCVFFYDHPSVLSTYIKEIQKDDKNSLELLNEAKQAMSLVNVDKEGDGFICKEAMEDFCIVQDKIDKLLSSRGKKHG